MKEVSYLLPIYKDIYDILLHASRYKIPQCVIVKFISIVQRKKITPLTSKHNGNWLILCVTLFVLFLCQMLCDI